MKRIRIVFCLVILFANNSSCKAQKIFTGSSSHFNYTLNYPSDWKAADIYGFALIMEPNEKKAKVLVTVADLSKKPMSLEEFANVWLKIIVPSEIQNFQIIDEGETSINDKMALYYIYSGEKDGVVLKCKRYTFSGESNIYELTYEAREENFDKYLNDAEEIIKSIKVTK